MDGEKTPRNPPPPPGSVAEDVTDHFVELVEKALDAKLEPHMRALANITDKLNHHTSEEWKRYTSLRRQLHVVSSTHLGLPVAAIVMSIAALAFSTSPPTPPMCPPSHVQ